MSEQARRKQLRAQYKLSRPEAGVYRIVNGANGKALLGATPNLPSIRGKLEFAQATNTPGVLDGRLNKDIRRYGLQAFSLEVLEVLEIKPEMTPAELLQDLAALDELWRERQDPALLY